MDVSEQDVAQLLRQLVVANLVTEESAGQFTFRHALIHDAAYSTLLLRKRRQYHRAIAEAIEQTYPDAAETHAADLSHHYFQAGEWQKALDYAQRAGEKAQTLYAPREAIAHLSRALDAARQLAVAPPARLYTARGRAHETVGEFEQAQADHEMALEMARAGADRLSEWEALLQLGALWAGRNYDETGRYYQEALTLARAIGDPATIARSLNRVGNWHVNVERPHEALQCHREALTIFERLDDARGMAETLDFLGVASSLGADLVQGSAYLERAVALFRALDDRQGLTSSLSVMALRGATYATDTIPVVVPLDSCVASVEEALELARQIGWRAGEAFADTSLGLCLGALGAYARAWEVTQQGLAIAQSIRHEQWQTAAHYGLGVLHLDTLDGAQAVRHLEWALTMARTLNSSYWIHATSAYLASALVVQNDLARADAVLSTVMAPGAAAQTMAQRMCWCARGEWAMASGNPALAAEIAGQLVASAPGDVERPTGLRLLRVQGEALTALGRWDEAAASLRLSQQVALWQGARPALWRVHAAWAAWHRQQGQHEAAAREVAAGRAVVEALALALPDTAQRDGYLRRALAWLHGARQLP